MVIGFAAALAPARWVALGVAVGPQAPATRTAASDCRNRLREMINSRSIGRPPPRGSAADYRPVSSGSGLTPDGDALDLHQEIRIREARDHDERARGWRLRNVARADLGDRKSTRL